jgi:DNA-nicking Smr family endonuclease
MKKKKRGNKYEREIEAEIDLHGMYRIEAVREVKEFLREAEEDGFRHVRIITGKGGTSGELGVLAATIRAYLNEYGYHYTEAKRADGGAGALNVTI